MPVLLRRSGRYPQRLFDAALAAAVVLLCWYAAAEAPDPPATGLREPAWLTAIAGIVLGVPLAVRRRHPLLAAAVVLPTAGLCLATGLVPDYSAVGPVTASGVAVYAVAAGVSARRSVAVLVTSVAVVGAGMLLAGDSADGLGSYEVGFVAVALGACWLLGWTVRERRTHTARIAAQATTQAVTEERLRIAREIHDIVGHSLAVIAVKSAIGSHVAAQRPAEAGAALDVIAATSRSALTELRRAVGALRAEPEFSPIPTLAELHKLADRATAAGIEVQLDVRGDCDVPDGVALAAVRIVQESLTNVVKHAGPTRCRVDVVGVPGELRVEVTDHGAGNRHPTGDGTGSRHPAGDGAGLTGMRERVALHAGSLTTGPHADGGFRVSATLPYEPSR